MEFEKNVKLSSNFRKCKFKEINKLSSLFVNNLCVKNVPPEEISPPPKTSEKSSSMDLW